MSRLRLGADCEGLVLVAEGDLILISATAPTAFRSLWLHRFSGEFGPRALGLTCTLLVAVTLMGSERWCTYCEGLLAFVAEGDLLLAATASMLYFVPTPFRLAVGGMVDLIRGVADVGRLTEKRRLTDAPLAI